MPSQIEIIASEKIVEKADNYLAKPFSKIFKDRQAANWAFDFFKKTFKRLGAFGIENPKEAGVHGKDVNELFDKQEYNKIADYVARDAYSTSILYNIWREYMSGEAESRK